MTILFRCFASLLALMLPVMLLAATPALAGQLKLEQKQGEMFSKLSLGKVELLAIQDVAMDMPLSKFKGPLSDEQRNAYAQKETNPPSVPASVNVFIIKVNGQIIMVDSGLGDLAEPESFFVSRLEQAGLTPGDIDLIILTHMHFDHIGGLLKAGAPLFPKAKIKVSNLEREFWLNPNLLKDDTYKANAELAQNVAKAYTGRFEGFEFNQEMAPGIVSLNAVGHTPGHTAFLVQSEDKALLIVGDLLHATALQFPHPDENAVFDMNPTQAAKSRKALLERAAREKLPIASMHIPFSGIGYVKENGLNGFEFTPMEIQK